MGMRYPLTVGMGLVAVGLVAMVLALGTSCENELLGRSSSPNGERMAVMFSRNCGATTGYSYQVSIVDRGGMPSGAGNVLVSERVPGVIPEPRWVSDEHVIVYVSKGLRDFMRSDSVDGVRVTFDEM